MYRFILFTLFLGISPFAYSQQPGHSAFAQWSSSGLQTSFESDLIVNILDYGADPSGLVSTNSAFLMALDQNRNKSFTLYFPEGNFLFDQTISIPSNCILKGEGNELTSLNFDLKGSGQAIVIAGSSNGPLIELNDKINLGSHKISVNEAHGLSEGDWIWLQFNDSSLMTSEWAYGLGGGLYQVKIATAKEIELTMPLRIEISAELNPVIKKIVPVENVAIECLKIERLDATAEQTSNIFIQHAVNCRFVGIESNKTNFAHLDIRYSQHILVRGCYFQDSHAFGGGGQGYGVVLQSGSGHCLIENNEFRKLRHSMLLQSGANANVLAYNSSVEPFWTQTFLPADAAGDLVCHGNYPYMNLFEGNIVQNIVVDASHGKNGPHNTFFRNRAMNYGILMSSGSGTDSTHFIANEIPNTGAIKGLYSLIGNGNIESGNIVKGQLVPLNSSEIWPSSLYRDSIPGFWSDAQPWPSIGDISTYNLYEVPARINWLDSIYTDCRLNPEYTPITSTTAVNQANSDELSIYPNPFNTVITLELLNAEVKEEFVYDLRGNLLLNVKMSSKLSIPDIPAGVYIFRVMSTDGQYYMKKVLKQ
jgi:hypothetical protein